MFFARGALERAYSVYGNVLQTAHLRNSAGMAEKKKYARLYILKDTAQLTPNFHTYQSFNQFRHMAVLVKARR